MVKSITVPNNEFAAATGSNVNSGPGTSTFDRAPNQTTNLVITSNAGDGQPFVFDMNETYDLSFDSPGRTTVIDDAVILRTDVLGAGQGAVVFAGQDQNGDLVHVVWSPFHDLQNWYMSNGGSDELGDDSGPGRPRFYTTEQDALTYTHVCFTPGMRLDTPRGSVAVEDLRPGHRVMTQDNGAQEILWIGQNTVAGLGNAAPVVIAPGALGNNRPLILSQQHRVLVRSIQAAVYFDQPEVWVPARSLVNGGSIRIRQQPHVTYYHVLLKRHEVLTCDGVGVESLYLGDVARRALCPKDRHEVSQFFPALASPGFRPLPCARMTLKRAEAEFLARAICAEPAPKVVTLSP